jgi:hypothetical protein
MGLSRKIGPYRYYDGNRTATRSIPAPIFNSL